MKNEVISVVIPVYNCEKYIKFCVDSVLAQKYKNYEVVIVNDGSTDRTRSILEKNYKKYSPKIKMIHQSNHGAASALNRGIKEARGRWVAWLSSDDMFLPDKLSKQAAFLAQNKECDMVYTDAHIIDENNKITSRIQSAWYVQEECIFKFIQGNFINGSSLVLRKELFKKNGYFNEGLRYSYDGDLFLRFLKAGARTGHMKECLIKYRWHKENMSHHFRRHFNETNRVLKDHIKNGFNFKSHPDFIPEAVFRKLYPETAERLFLKKHFYLAGYIIFDLARNTGNILSIFLLPVFLLKYSLSLISRVLRRTGIRQ